MQCSKLHYQEVSYETSFSTRARHPPTQTIQVPSPTTTSPQNGTNSPLSSLLTSIAGRRVTARSSAN